MEGVMIATGRAIRPGASPEGADLLDVAPTVLRLLGVPVPSDMDGRVLSELINSDEAPAPASEPDKAQEPGQGDQPPATPPSQDDPGDAAYTEEEDAAIQQRLADLGYL